MHGAHSAVAIKRQRRRREHARRAPPRVVADHTISAQAQQQQMSNKVMGTITMFHVGAVFLTVGLFLVLASITSETSPAEIAELIGTGVVCLVIGLFLVILNRFYGQKEEEELHNYVESRLARTRSGQRLYHEAESVPERLDQAQDAPQEEETSSKKSRPKKKKQKRSKEQQGHQIRVQGSDVLVGPDSITIVNERSRRASSSHQQNANASTSKHLTAAAAPIDDADRSDLYRVYDVTGGGAV